MEANPNILDQQQTIEAFLAATAQRRPTPGGGSVTALAGALAAAIGEMALNYSIGKQTVAEVAGEIRPMIEQLSRARRLLLTLMAEDQRAYAALSELHKRPVEDWGRATALPGAVMTCIRVPQAIGATGLAILELCDRAVEQTNPRLLSDLAIAAELAMTTVRCAGYNCRANLNELSDAGEQARIVGECASELARAAILIQRVLPRIWERHAEEVRRQA